MSARRGTSNSNERGNSTQRRQRREWLLRVYQSDHGPGTVRCYRCGSLLEEKTLTVDRIVPGCFGGRYNRENTRPCCSKCNSSTGGALARRAA